MNSLYREEILEHYRNPLNFGKMVSYSVCARQTNPFCGDEIKLFIKFQDDLSVGADTKTPLGWCKIEDISFLGKGCAISIASTSILSEHVKGKTKLELTRFEEKDMLDLLGVEVSQTRKKCALLGWAVLRDCLKQSYGKT